MRSVFFFKRKTAYEMRISDWSSDVCSAMVAVMKGSYWLTSGADIARSTLGYAEIGPGPMSRRAGGSMGPGIGVMLTDAPSLSSRGSPVSTSGLSCGEPARSEEHTSELQSLIRNSYAVFCLKKK